MRLTKSFPFIELKSAPDYGRSTSMWPNFRFTGWGWNKGYKQAAFTEAADSLDKSSLVMAVVNDTATALAEALPSVRKKNRDGKFEEDPTHKAALLVQRPNILNIWEDYCFAISLSWWIDGNFYALKERNATGEVSELWYLPHFMVEERWPNDGKSPEVPTSGKNKAENTVLSHYQYSVPGKEPILYKASEIIHIKRGANPQNPRTGISAFESVVTEIYGDGKAAEFTATILKNMGIVVPLFMPKDDSYQPTPTEAKAFKEKWKQETTGDNTGNAMVMSLPLKPEKYTFSPQELDLKELRKVPESRIAAVTRYPAAYLQFLSGLENGTSYASYKQAREQAYEQVVIPIQQIIARNLTHQLVSEFDNVSQFFFDTSEVRVLQEDRDALFKRESEALRAGGITIDQYLSSLGKEPVGSPLGDIRFIPSTSTPMSPEKLEMTAGDMTPPPESVPIDPASLAKFADLERWYEGLESQMKEFVRGNEL